jgi:hypothetical protein
LSRKCGILNISQTYRPSWSVTETALLLRADINVAINITEIGHKDINLLQQG